MVCWTDKIYVIILEEAYEIPWENVWPKTSLTAAKGSDLLCHLQYN